MTAAADTIRDRRRAFAAPGGSHARLVRFLAKWLPAAIGAIAAVMILSPLAPRGEISFLLDRNKVAIAEERLRVDDATYRGIDNHDRAFTVTAGSAVQKSAAEPIVHLDRLIARIMLDDGPAALSAQDGTYNYQTEQVRVLGDVGLAAADGYRMVTRNVVIDLKERSVTGSGGVSGEIPSGTFSAERITADLQARTIALEGNARLRMAPGQLRMPR
ncbi:MAG TPA: LPS export ABC transporter periplasmic protein LptC [Novosphingobium sp.]|nr:LPS export ABC transporter periplasmic protein LptC [Novosphingobium sp.]